MAQIATIETRLAALADAIRRRQMEQGDPIDPLSASMFSWERELAALDEQGKDALLEALNDCGVDGTAGLDLDMEPLERMIEEETR